MIAFWFVVVMILLLPTVILAIFILFVSTPKPNTKPDNSYNGDPGQKSKNERNYTWMLLKYFKGLIHKIGNEPNDKNCYKDSKEFPPTVTIHGTSLPQGK